MREREAQQYESVKIFLRLTRQGICSCICLVLSIIDSEMVSRELLGLTDLSGAQTLCIHETTEVIVICEDENLMLGAFQVMAPCLKDFDDS